MRRVPLSVLPWLGVGLIALALFAATWAVAADAQGPARRLFARYVAYLERKLRLMFIFDKGRTIALTQLGLLGVVAALGLAFGLPLGWLVAVAIVVGPPWAVERARQKRVERIEAQLDTFLLALANALKTTPSIGDAFGSVQTLVAAPLRQEVELSVKEMRLGSTLDQALLHMAGRVGSRQLDAALSSVLVGRQIGGNLPRILETTSESLREMARLEGVVRSKTAEGKAQLWVLALFPFVMIFALNAVREGYFEPLTESVTGYVVALVAAGFWVSSLVVARKVLAVDV